MNLKEILAKAAADGVAVGHFNISDLTTLRAIFDAARALNVPVMIGTSEGEREFVTEPLAAAMVRRLREEYSYPVFLNADHTHSLEKAIAAAKAGYDEILFDGGKLPFEENIARTKEVVAAVKAINPDILVEGELGFIGSSSQILKSAPEGAAMNPEDFTKPEEASQFVKETGVDMLAPAVGNLHGMFADQPNPRLDIARIRAIKEEAKVPLVLHGGSGTQDDDFRMAIRAGISVVHINTELRKAWSDGLREALAAHPDEIVPYKILGPALAKGQQVVTERLRLFNEKP